MVAMIATVFLSILLCSIYGSAQNQAATNFSIADDQANWAELWKAISAAQSADGRSDVAASTRPALFDIILRVNAQARRTSRPRSGGSEFLFQGDIAMNKRDVVAMFRNGGRRKRAVMKKLATKLWQRNNIAYVISSDLGVFAKRGILAAIKQWENTLPCMGKWKDISKLHSTKRARDYIRFIKGGGCYSRVGRQGGRQVISIGTGCEHTGVVIHEIGHAMGFWHEQSRTDRDNYVEIHWNNILPGMKFNFNKYPSSKINDLGVGYDYESVMHYGSTAFSKDGRALTISIKRGKTKNSRVRLGQKYQLSDKDKKQAQLLYNCNIKSPCSSYRCFNGGICTNNGCRCTSTYTGVMCEKKVIQHCVDKDRRCNRWGRRGYCNPENGYEDVMKQKCCATCRFHTTIKRRPCSSSPCLNGGVCTNNGNRYRCGCKSGYSGTRCQVKVSPCSSAPCLNGGVCRNNGNKFSCRCTSSYTGVRCETKTNCKDKHTFCASWSKNNFCHLKQFKSFMQKNCVVSCRFPC